MELVELKEDDLMLKVHDVGQANWNEILQGETVSVVFDFGAPLQSTKTFIKSIYDSCEALFKRDKPMLIISHWDVDHISCLTCLDEQAFRDCFSKVICVDQIKTRTANNIFQKISRGLPKSKIAVLSPAMRTDGKTMHLWKTCGCLSIYQGEKNRDINLSGLCTFVRGKEKSANLTGDLRLLQADDSYKQELNNLQTQEHILVAPHHGADYKNSKRFYSSPTSKVIISVGKANKYNHPHPDMLNYLIGLSHSNVVRTDLDGEIVESL